MLVLVLVVVFQAQNTNTNTSFSTRKYEVDTKNMSPLLIKNKNGFDFGFTPITSINEKEHNTDIHFGILKLKAHEVFESNVNLESAYLLMHGQIEFMFDHKKITVKRESLFEEDPIALHVAQKEPVTITALTDCEIAVFQVKNEQMFSPILFDQHNLLESEHRGKGQLDDTAYRIVRTIFDIRNRPEAKLVLGEVITFPGRWSSYPPHHHPQPEIYHYRFSKPQGFGFGQTGDTKGNEQVAKIEHYDTLKILYDLTHAHSAAPGYGMYYIWAIRHLPDNPYTIPIFESEHQWTML